MDILIQAGQLLLSLSLLIILHEMGHFFFAKLFKTRVEKFYLFFNPWFSLFKYKKGETEYGLGWLPLGGYVKISGMIDESMDKEQLKKPPQPHEFRSKPAWQRLLIMLGGVLMNFFTALIIFIFLLYIFGRDYLPVNQMRHGVVCDTFALELGFQNGDKLVNIDGQVPESFSEVNKIIVSNSPQFITIERNGEIKKIDLPEDIGKTLISKEAIPFFSPAYSTKIDSVVPGSVAERVGIIENDSVISINGKPTPYFNHLSYYIALNRDKEVNLEIVRGGEVIKKTVKVPGKNKWYDFKKQERGIGIAAEDLPYKHINYSISASIPAGIKFGVTTLADYVKQLKYIFTKEGFSKLGGFGAIGSLFPKVWDWSSFWHLTAFLSIILAFMNILPIPALDGGHVLFLMFELVTGRKPGDKFMEYAQITGMVILISLLIYANANDIVKLFH